MTRGGLRLLVVGGLVAVAVAGVVGFSGAAFAAPVPSPAPTAGGFVAKSWTCSGANTVGSPTVTNTANDCAVTGWAPVVPVATPYPVTVVNTSVPVTLSTASPVSVSGAGLTSDQWDYLSFSAGLVVFLVAAHFVAGWRR